MDSVGTFLGAFTYSSSGKPVQTFQVEVRRHSGKFTELQLTAFRILLVLFFKLLLFANFF